MSDLSLFEQFLVLFLLATSGIGVRCMYQKFRDK
jgi:hypothetical protein